MDTNLILEKMQNIPDVLINEICNYIRICPYAKELKAFAKANMLTNWKPLKNRTIAFKTEEEADEFDKSCPIEYQCNYYTHYVLRKENKIIGLVDLRRRYCQEYCGRNICHIKMHCYNGSNICNYTGGYSRNIWDYDTWSYVLAKNNIRTSANIRISGNREYTDYLQVFTDAYDIDKMYRYDSRDSYLLRAFCLNSLTTDKYKKAKKIRCISAHHHRYEPFILTGVIEQNILSEYCSFLRSNHIIGTYIEKRVKR